MSRKQKILEIAKELFEAKKRDGAIAVLSPTPFDLIDNVLQYIYENLNENITRGCLVDVGCGDGRWVTSFVKACSGHAIGLDIEVSRISLATECSRELRDTARQRVDFMLSSYSCYCFASASIIVIYLSRYGNDIVKSKIQSECLPGTVVIAVGFQMNGLTPVESFKSQSTGINAYLYTL